MESQIVTQVLGVEQRQSKNGQHTMYDVALADGKKYTTFDYDLAAQAQGLMGQQVAANIEMTVNGKYTNLNLNQIGLPGSLPAPAPEQGQPLAGGPQPFQAGAAATPAAGPQQTTFPQAATPSYGPDENDKLRMSRFSAASTAFNFVTGLFQGAGPEAGGQAVTIAQALTDNIVAFGLTGSWGGQAQPATPAQVAAAVPGVQVGVANIEQPAPAAQAATPDDIPWN